MAKQSLSKVEHHSVQITMAVSGGSKWQVEPELTPDELKAIGLITVQWAHLEHCLLLSTMHTAESAGVGLPADAQNLSFAKRLRAFRDFAKLLKNDDAKVIENLADRIANAQDKRHKVTHGMWDWSQVTPDQLTNYSFRLPHHYEHPFDLQKLRKLGAQLGELIFDMSFPNGFLDVQALPCAIRFPGVVVAGVVPPKYRPSSTDSDPAQP